MDDVMVERVLRIVELIPEARTVSYGTVALVAGCTARYVGRVMKEYGANVTWWKVTNVARMLPPEIHARARLHWEDEGTPHTHDRVGKEAYLTVDELVALWNRHGVDPGIRCAPSSGTLD